MILRYFKPTITTCLVLLGLALGTGAQAQQQAAADLSFKKGQFKIAQFTDLHWDPASPTRMQTARIIQDILLAEHPDLAVVSGDIVTSFPAEQGWNELAAVFEESKMPWAITLGNHDEEAGMTRPEIFHFLKGKPYFKGELGEPTSGAGNYVLPIQGANTIEPAFLLYFMDTHNRPSAHMYGRYNWIQADQVNWYRNSSDHFTAHNNNLPVPALAFLHIPLKEYKDMVDSGIPVVGHNTDGVSPSQLNSGMFASFVDKGDVIGIFVGHDHDNDYIGQYLGVALAYGRTTGYDAEGDREKGARIIQLYEGQNRFDTWIRTPDKIEFVYDYPAGTVDNNTQALTFAKPLSLRNPLPGLQYLYYEGGRLENTSDISKNGKLIKTGITDKINLDHHVARDSFAFIFDGYISIPEDGIYNFYTFSDDGSTLTIGDKVVVDNDGSHDVRRKDGKIALRKGYHKFKVEYFDDYMGELLEVGMSYRNMKEQVIPARLLFHQP